MSETTPNNTCRLCQSSNTHVKYIHAHGFEILECDACQFRFNRLSKQPLNLSQDSDQRSAERDATFESELSSARSRIDLYVSHTGRTPQGEVLEIGAAQGALGIALTEGYDLNYHGVELASSLWPTLQKIQSNKIHIYNQPLEELGV